MTHSAQNLPVSLGIGSDQYEGQSPEPIMSMPPTVRRDFSVSEYGKEFDEAAKERMIAGCGLLSHFVKKYASRIRGNCVEFGPFKNPLLLPESFPDCAISFVDGDFDVCQHLRGRYRSNKSVHVITADLNAPHVGLLRRLPRSVDVFVASQVLNYVDLNRFLTILSRLAATDAILFVNNVPHYGIPQLFSENRPRDNAHVVSALRQRGWTIVEENYVPPQFEQQKDDRLILVARAPQRPFAPTHRRRHVQEAQLFSEPMQHEVAVP